MSYQAAIAAFRENITLLIRPQKDPMMWNLCTGLLQLSEAMEKDMKVLRQKVEAIDTVVKNIQ
ncbi:MAG TPA: hypothetical protein VGG27_11115 [Magnetospirillaceae bacterium]|jgi:hypothetical protein